MKLIAISVAVLGSLLSVSTASAETYAVKRAQATVLSTYCQVYVPATVVVNTRGKLVNRESQAWVISGNQWSRVRNPAVYIQTSKVVESDHYTLVPGVCN